jgi:methylmalonyl-CoA mutase C-terminal domain/subunit
MDQLREHGIGKLFGPGTPTSELIDYIKDWFATREAQDAPATDT